MSRISSFIQFDTHEQFEREYFITHTSMKRFSLRVILWLVAGFILFAVPALLVWQERVANPWKTLLLLLFALPELLLVLLFSLRKLKISYGYATITNQRILYYEFNEHHAENYHYVKSLYLADITAMSFGVERTIFRKSFRMAVFTEHKALAVGAQSWTGWLKFRGSERHLEPGPEALEFIQHMAGQVVAHKFLPEASSKVVSV